VSGLRRVAGIFFGPFMNKRFQVKFKDRYTAGEMLGDVLKKEIKTMLNQDNQRKQELVVAGIPTGGLITALAVARKLSATLDVVIAKRLVAPQNEEITIGAVTNDLIIYLDEENIDALNVSQEYLESEKAIRFEEFKSTSRKFHLDNSRISENNMKGKTVVLVDDGAASGATLVAAIRYLKTLNHKYLIVCVPVAPKQTVQLLKNEADKVFCIFMPNGAKFRSVEQYYVDFSHLTDAHFADIIEKK
jgi:putative phosphoribosyl transferase